MISCQIQRPVHRKYLATSHGKGVVDGIGGAAKACVREKVKGKMLLLIKTVVTLLPLLQLSCPMLK